MENIFLLYIQESEKVLKLYSRKSIYVKECWPRVCIRCESRSNPTEMCRYYRTEWEGCAAIQRDLLAGEVADKNFTKRKMQEESQQEKCRVLHLGRNILKHQYVLGAPKLESSSAEKYLGVLVGTWLNMSQQYGLSTRRLTAFLVTSGRVSPAGQGS